MTLKEKVSEVEPSSVNNIFAFGVSGCPDYYDYLHVKCDCAKYKNCFECWNREYKEVSDEIN